MNKSSRHLILMVDDHPENLSVLGTILSENGWDIAIAMSGAEAISSVAAQKPDLILLDIMLPDIDGFEVLEKIKENHKLEELPVMFLTALNQKEDRLRALNSGAVDYIVKPFLKEEVIARVKIQLRVQSLISELDRLSVTDEMTDTFNRRFAYHIIPYEIEHAKRRKESFILAYIDINNLKNINDNFGHEQGDKLINAVVLRIKEAIRRGDYIFRMGGDEFLVLFHASSLKDAHIIIERIRKSLKDDIINSIEPDFSYGLVKFDIDSDCSVDELIKLADKRMYIDKKKNRLHYK